MKRNGLLLFDHELLRAEVFFITLVFGNTRARRDAGGLLVTDTRGDGELEVRR